MKPMTSSRPVVPALSSSLLALTVALAPPAHAALPTVEAPSRSTGTGILATLQDHAFDIVTLVALLVIAVMFVGVCYHAYTSYAEIHTQRRTWGDFGLTVGVGAVLLVVGIWLLTTATGIL